MYARIYTLHIFRSLIFTSTIDNAEPLFFLTLTLWFVMSDGVRLTYHGKSHSCPQGLPG